MTMTYWLIVSVMIGGALFLLLPPLLKRSPSAPIGEREKVLPLYRQQFAELEQDRKNGVLTDDQYQQARRELERRLLEESGRTETTSTTRLRLSPRLVAGALAVLIPLASVLLYFQLGNPLAITHPTVPAMPAQAGSEYDHQSSSGLDALAERLKLKLDQNPNDGAGWALLARSYVELGRHTEAVRIYEKAMSLMPDDAQLLTDYADALGVLHGRKLAGKPEVLIQQALKLDPRNVKALMLAGTVAFDRKDYARAARYWEQARTNLPPDAEQEVTQELMAGIAEAKDLLAGGQKTMTAYADSEAPVKPSRQVLAISGKVSVAPSLASKGSPTDTLFVFAREVNGPPMPVAIVRATKKDLPFTFRLDDSTSPMPSRKLSDVRTVVIVARLSKSGNAMPQSGDLQGKSGPVKPGVHGVNVVIDTELP